MMKKIAVGIAVAIGLTLLNPVQAQAANESIVIIDNAIDSTLPEFNGKLIYEVCRPVGGTCPNGKTEQEGLGSATLPKNIIYTKDTWSNHGTVMALIALKTNPNAQIIFIRVGTVSKNVINRLISEAALASALDWVNQNRAKFNIVAVSSSLAADSSGACPLTKASNRNIVANTNTLVSNGVAVFYPAGNNSRSTSVAFPACISSAFAVSGTNALSVDDGYVVSPLVTRSKDVEYYAVGAFNTSARSAVFGDSSSGTASLAAYWLKNYKGSYAATKQHLDSVVKTITKGVVPTNLFVDTLG
jgi:hypothetical protein